MSKKTKLALLIGGISLAVIAVVVAVIGLLGGIAGETISPADSKYIYDYSLDQFYPHSSQVEIDGALDDALWQNKQWYTNTNLTNLKGTDTKFYVTMTADEYGLYIASKSDDTNVYGQGTVSTGWTFYLGVGEKGSERQNTVNHMTFDVRGNVTCELANIQSSFSVDGELNSAATKGASIEIFVPWESLHIDTSNGIPEYYFALMNYTYITSTGNKITIQSSCEDAGSTHTYFRFDKNGYINADAEDATIGDTYYGYGKTFGWDYSQIENGILRSEYGYKHNRIFFKEYAENYVIETTIIPIKALDDGRPRAGILFQDINNVWHGVFLDCYDDILTEGLNGTKNFNNLHIITISNNDGGWNQQGPKGGYQENPIASTTEGAKLKVIKQNDILYYFVNDTFFYAEELSYLDGEMIPGLVTIGCDAIFKDYSCTVVTDEELEAELNKHGVYSITTKASAGGTVESKQVCIQDGDSYDLQIICKSGYIVSSVEINGVERIEDARKNAIKGVYTVYDAQGPQQVEVRFEKIQDGATVSGSITFEGEAERNIDVTIANVNEGLHYYVIPGSAAKGYTCIVPKGSYLISAAADNYMQVFETVEVGADTTFDIVLRASAFAWYPEVNGNAVSSQPGYWDMTQEVDGKVSTGTDLDGKAKPLYFKGSGTDFVVQATIKYTTEFVSGVKYQPDLYGGFCFSNGSQEQGLWARRAGITIMNPWTDIDGLTNEHILTYPDKKSVTLTLIKDGDMAYIMFDDMAVYSCKWSEISDGMSAKDEYVVGLYSLFDYQADIEYSNFSITFDPDEVDRFVANNIRDVKEIPNSPLTYYVTVGGKKVISDTDKWDISHVKDGYVTASYDDGARATSVYFKDTAVNFAVEATFDYDTIFQEGKDYQPDLFGGFCFNNSSSTGWVAANGNGFVYDPDNWKTAYDLIPYYALSYPDKQPVKFAIVKKGNTAYIYFNDQLKKTMQWSELVPNIGANETMAIGLFMFADKSCTLKASDYHLYTGTAAVNQYMADIEEASKPVAITSLDQIVNPYGNYYLTGDIKGNTTTITNFSGTIDGKGYTVETSVPLFEQLKGGADVKNLNINLTKDLTAAGVLAAVADNVTITNVRVFGTGKLTGPDDAAVGGLVGNVCNSYISSCSNAIDVVGVNGQNAGGIAGETTVWENGSFVDCTNTGDITSTGASGGILGLTTREGIEFCGCSNSGEIKGAYAGGIIGRASGGYMPNGEGITITDSENNKTVNTGNISATMYAGGIIGQVDGTFKLSIANATNDGDIEAPLGVGGIGGSASYATQTVVTDCVNNGTVTCTTTVVTDANAYFEAAGGIWGLAEGGDTTLDITDSTNNGDVSGLRAGGIFGKTANAVVELTDVSNYGTVTGSEFQGELYAETAGTGAVLLNGSNYQWNEYRLEDAYNRDSEYKSLGTDGITTIVVGDSFFDKQYWTTFATDFEGKDALCLGISGSKAEDWLQYIAYSAFMYDIAPKNVVFNLGNNDLHNDKSVERYTQNMQNLLTQVHDLMPLTKLYMFSVAHRVDVGTNDRVDIANAQMKAWCEAQGGWITFIDISDKLSTDMLFDGIHPAPQYYAEIFVPALLEAGCVVEDRTEPEAKPITSLSELNGKDGAYYLAGDITDNTTTVFGFTGTLDGRGHTVHTTVPLFDELYGTVKNLNIDLTADLTASGVLAATAEYVQLENVYVSGAGKLTGPADASVGGLVGNVNNCTISSCSNALDITAADGMHAGGIAGEQTQWENGTFTDCVNSGTITSTAGAGGILGFAQREGITFNSCTNTGEIGGAYAGGIVGDAAGGYMPLGTGITIADSQNSGVINATQHGGGIVGRVDGTVKINIDGSVNDGTVSAMLGAGGIGGAATYSVTVTVTDCVNNGDVISTTDTLTDANNYFEAAGGIWGLADGGPTTVSISDTVNNGDVSGLRAAGISGKSANATVILTNVTNNGTVSGSEHQGEYFAEHAGAGGVTLDGVLIGFDDPGYSAAQNRQEIYAAKGIDGISTIFVGDSFTDPQLWMEQDISYEGKEVLSLGIGGTEAFQWINYIRSHTFMYDIAPKNAVFNLGTNDLICGNTKTPADYASDMQTLLTLVHEEMPNTNLYMFSVPYHAASAHENHNPDHNEIVDEANALMQAWCEEQGWVKFIYITDQLTADKLVDGVHPIGTHFEAIYFTALENAGCEIEDEYFVPISSMDELNGQGGKFYLTGNITDNSTTVTGFTGTLDGKGYTVSTTVPLFDELQGTVKNLNIKLTKDLTAQGVLAAKADNAIIENVAVSGTGKLIAPDGLAAGGLVGQAASSKFISCSNAVHVIGANNKAVGGIAGETVYANVSFTDCSNSGIVLGNGDSSFAGGILGQSDWDNISFYGCSNSGSVSGYAAGGIVGFTRWATSSGVTIADSEANTTVNTGRIAGSNSAGGMVGYVDNSKVIIENAENKGQIAGVRAGGIGGNATSGAVITVTKCVNNGEIMYYTTQWGEAGGIWGYIGGGYADTVIIQNSTNNGDVTAPTAGGIVGKVEKANEGTEAVTIKNCTNTGTITGFQRSYDNAEGVADQIVGEAATTVTESENTENGSATATVLTWDSFGIGSVYQRYTTYAANGTDGVTTIFVGDSFMDPSLWSNCAIDFAGKDVLALGIGGSKTVDWLNYINNELFLYDIAPKNVVFNMGINDIVGGQATAEEYTANMQQLLTKVHELMPDTKVYMFSVVHCGIASDTDDTVDAANAIMSQWCQQCEWATFVDVSEQVSTDMLYDGTHPFTPYYRTIYKPALEAAGIELANSANPVTVPEPFENLLPVTEGTISGNIIFDEYLGEYFILTGTASTEAIYDAVEIKATVETAGWPVQGFVVKQGSNVVKLMFGTDIYNTTNLLVYVDDTYKGTISATNSALALWSTESLKMTFDGTNINIYRSGTSGSWTKVNSNSITLNDLNSIAGTVFDPTQPISVGLGSASKCGGIFKDVSLEELTVCTITYEGLEGAASKNPDTYIVGATDELLPPETRDGYIFLGWYIGDTQITSLAGQTGNLTITAKWEAEPVIPGDHTMVAICNNDGTHTKHCIDDGCDVTGVTSNCLFVDGKCTICDPKPMDEDADIRVMNFNILCNDWTDNEDPAIRMPNIVATITDYLPDVVGLEEVSGFTRSGQSTSPYNALKTALAGTGYEFVYTKTEDGSHNYTTIVYNTNTLNLITYGVKNYSHGSNNFARNMLWGLFEVKATGKYFISVNTHWSLPDQPEYLEPEAADLSAFVNEMYEKYGCPVIVTGDFNVDADNTYYASYLSGASMIDAAAGAEEKGLQINTYHDWGKNDIEDAYSGVIDHVSYLNTVTAKYYSVIYNAPISESSDHYPVYADLQLPEDYDVNIDLKNDVLSVKSNATFDNLSGVYKVTANPGYAVTEQSYRSAELTVNIATDGWPMDGFAVKQGSNVVSFIFGTNGGGTDSYNYEHILTYVNGTYQGYNAVPTASAFNLAKGSQYELKLTYVNGSVNVYNKTGEDWVQINASPISLATLIGSSFDATQGVQIGIAGQGSTCAFINVTVTEIAVADNGLLSELDGATYDADTGTYKTGTGTAFTADAYKNGELTVTLATDGWPIEGFAVKQGSNVVRFRFNTCVNSGFTGEEQILVYVNGTAQPYGTVYTNNYNFALYDNRSYTMKLVYEDGILNIYNKNGENWELVNKDPISLATLIGSGFDATQGVQLGITGWGSTGCVYSDVVVTEIVPVDNGPLSEMDGATYDAETGTYEIATGTALTADTYKNVELSGDFYRSSWPIQGFVVKQGDNVVKFRFATECAAWYGAEQVLTYVNGTAQAYQTVATVNNDFALWGGTTYTLKLTYADGAINLYNGTTKINANDISLATLLGDAYDANAGVQVGIIGYDGCGGTVSNVAVQNNAAKVRILFHATEALLRKDELLAALPHEEENNLEKA